MTARASRRALRVGVVLGEQLVEERVFPHGAPVTFGRSLRCALSVPGDGIPEAHVLFAPAQGRVLLRVTANMCGRLAHDEQVRTELHDGPGDRGVWTIPLESGACGRLQIGDATLLFQDVAAPAAAPRPVLPSSLRGTLGQRIDRRLAAVIGASLLAHLGLAAYAWMTDADDGSMFAPSIAYTYRHERIDVVLPDEPSPALTVAAPSSPSTPPGPGAAAPVAPPRSPPTTRARPGVRLADPAPSDAEIARFASMLTGPDTTRTGTGGRMSDRKPGADLREQLADVRGGVLRVGDDGRTFREQPGPRLGTDTRPLVDDPTQVSATEPKRPERDPARVVVRPVPRQPGPDTTLTVAIVLAKINTVYMRGLSRCYREGLATDPTLAGKGSVAFTVTERGTLEDPTARGVTPDVDACIAAQMAGWRFPIPRDQDGDPATASFQLVLALQPS